MSSSWIDDEGGSEEYPPKNHDPFDDVFSWDFSVSHEETEVDFWSLPDDYDFNLTDEDFDYGEAADYLAFAFEEWSADEIAGDPQKGIVIDLSEIPQGYRLYAKVFLNAEDAINYLKQAGILWIGRVVRRVGKGGFYYSPAVAETSR